MNHVLAGKPKPKPLTKEQRKKGGDPNDPEYQLNLLKEKKKIQ